MNNHGEPSSSYLEDEQEQEEEVNLSPTQLLKLAETHLRVRNFSLCHNYILEFQQQPNNPNFPSNNLYASQLLTISNILSNPTDYYSILQITPFCNDFNLIRSQFNHIIALIDPIKDRLSVGNEALNLVKNAYGCLSDPTKKTQFDSQYVGQRSESESVNLFDVGTFWTFCPYCFYMYQFPRAYEGCCLKCQNENCGRAFHGVAVNSLPKMEVDKGVYFSCFGYFPLGFSPQSESAKKGSGKFESWSPIMGMIPMQRIEKTHMNDVGYEGFSNGNFVEVSDESDDESGNAQGMRGVKVGNAQSKKQKSVPSSARKLTSRGGKGNDGVGVGVGVGVNGGYGNEDGFNIGNGGVGDESGVGVDDMAFFEEDGEIFVGLGADDAL